MVAQNSVENDEEIIDLTELIEKGDVPAADKAAPAPRNEDEIQAHMQSLNDPDRADDEIDALLAQMESKDDEAAQNVVQDLAPSGEPEHAFASAPSLGSSTAERMVDPHEELNMPGISEVDNLLNSLDIPPQPQEHASDGPPESAEPDSVDNAVDQLLNAMAGVSPAKEKDSDLDDLLAAASEPSGKDFGEDLDDLLRENAPVADTAAPQGATEAPAPHIATEAAADIRVDMTAQATPSPARAQTTADESDLAADLDSLLASFSPEGTPADAEQNNLEHTEPAALLDAPADLLPDAAKSTSAESSSDTPPTVSADAPLDLTDTGAAKDRTATTDSGAAESGVDESDLAADLDSLLASIVQEPEEALPAPDTHADAPNLPEPEEIPQDAEKITDMGESTGQDTQPEADLDASLSLDKLLAAMDPEREESAPQMEPEAAPETVSHEPEAHIQEVQDTVDIPADAADATQDSAESHDEAARTASPDQAASHSPTADAADAADAPAEPGDDVARTAAPDSPTAVESGVQSVDMDAQSPDIDDEKAGMAEAAPLPAAEEVAQPPAEEETAPPVSGKESAPGPESEADRALDAPEEKTALADLDDLPLLLDDSDPCKQEDTQALSQSAQAEETETTVGPALPAQADLVAAGTPETARIVPLDAAPAMTKEFMALDQRLRRCEADLEEARARIEALEQASAAPRPAPPSLEDLLREGNPLHDRFAELIASSVRQALKAMPSVMTETVLDERLQAVNLAGKSVSARMDALEGRLDNLEPRFNAQVEKAAASAAARILREEIARLLAD